MGLTGAGAGGSLRGVRVASGTTGVVWGPSFLEVAVPSPCRPGHAATHTHLIFYIYILFSLSPFFFFGALGFWLRVVGRWTMSKAFCTKSMMSKAFSKSKKVVLKK
jgi:hypothetical protein